MSSHPPDSAYKEFLARLQEEHGAHRADVFLAFSDAKKILGQEIRELAGLRLRRRRSPWAMSSRAEPAVVERTLQTVQALASERRVLFAAIIDELRRTEWCAPDPDPLGLLGRRRL